MMGKLKKIKYFLKPTIPEASPVRTERAGIGELFRLKTKYSTLDKF